MAEYDDPIEAAKRRTMTGQSNFPAANQFTRPNYRPFASGAAINTADMNTQSPNTSQLGIGQIGLGAIGNALGRRTNPADQLFAPQPQQQPTLQGYHWYAGTGGVSGGNNAFARYYWSDNSVTREPAGSQNATPRLGLPRSDQPAIGSVPPIQYTLPGVNAAPNALGDPSVGALESARRTTNQFGQQVINPSGGGQIITGAGPSTPLQTTFQYTNPNGQNVRGLPGGGQVITASRDKQMPIQPPNGQAWLGGWTY